MPPRRKGFLSPLVIGVIASLFSSANGVLAGVQDTGVAVITVVAAYPIVEEAAKIGLYSFGGPAGQIAIMHQELVERRRWISERRFLHALNYCMVLPGPEALRGTQTYTDWLDALPDA